MSELINYEICEGVSFGCVRDDRFKAGRLVIKLLVPLSRSTAAANALLSWVLTRSCRQYPDFTSLNRKLGDLYGAALYPSVRRIGDFQLISVSASGLDDRYSLEGESVSSELAELLCQILFEPKLIDGRFDPEDIEQERRQLLENIDSEYSDKRSFAINRCIEVMCREELYSIGRYGTRKDVEDLTQEQLMNAWKKLLENAVVSVTMLGSADPAMAIERFRQYFGVRPRRMKGSTQIVPQSGEVKRITETDEISQSKLVMGYRCAYPQTKRQRIANTLMSVILGGTPTSKLFVNVREKQSLCYYCAARADNEKGILIIDSGVETDNIDRTEKAVTEQVELLKKGIISDEEMIAAKLAAKNAFLSATDSLAALDAFYTNSILRDEILSPTEAAEIVETITKEEIGEMSSRIELDTVYSLVGN